jgi:hypothetical protein
MRELEPALQQAFMAPARACADHHHVIEVLGRLNAEANSCGQRAGIGRYQGRAVRKQHDWQLVGVKVVFAKQGEGIGVRSDVEPAVGHMVAGEKAAQAVILGGPAWADNAQAFKRWLIASLPVFEQVVECGVELLFGRIPRLVEVVVDAG